MRLVLNSVLVAILCMSCSNGQGPADPWPEWGSPEATQRHEGVVYVDDAIANGDSPDHFDEPHYSITQAKAENYLNAPLGKQPLIQSECYAHETVVEIEPGTDISPMSLKAHLPKEMECDTDASWPNNILPIHAVIKIHSDKDVKPAIEAFEHLKMIVSTIELQFSEAVKLNDSLVRTLELTTVPEYKTRVILSGMGEAPVNVRTLHFVVKAAVVQINNFALTKTYGDNFNIWVSELFMGTRLDITKTGPIDRHLRIEFKPPIVIHSTSLGTKLPDIVLQNCYFAEHKQHSMVTIGGGEFGIAYLRNIGIYSNDLLIFDLPVRNQVVLDHVTVGRDHNHFYILHRGTDPEIVQKFSHLDSEVFSNPAVY